MKCVKQPIVNYSALSNAIIFFIRVHIQTTT